MEQQGQKLPPAVVIKAPVCFSITERRSQRCAEPGLGLPGRWETSTGMLLRTFPKTVKVSHFNPATLKHMCLCLYPQICREELKTYDKQVEANFCLKSNKQNSESFAALWDKISSTWVFLRVTVCRSFIQCKISPSD